MLIHRLNDREFGNAGFNYRVLGQLLDPSFHDELLALMEKRWAEERAARAARGVRPDSSGNPAPAAQRQAPVSYLRDQLSGTFMNRSHTYVHPKSGVHIVFDRECRLYFEDCVFVRSHAEPEPLASVRDGSLLVNLPSQATFWVRKLRDTTGARELVADIQSKRVQGCSMKFHVTGYRDAPPQRGRETVVATSAVLEHICAEKDPAAPWTSIKVF